MKRARRNVCLCEGEHEKDKANKEAVSNYA